MVGDICLDTDSKYLRVVFETCGFLPSFEIVNKINVDHSILGEVKMTFNKY